MTDHDEQMDDRLRRLLTDAASDVEPHDRIREIRDSVRADRPTRRARAVSQPRPWVYAASGTIATAAVIGIVAYATGTLPGQGDHTQGPTVAQQGPSDESGPTGPTGSPSPSTGAPGGTQRAYAVYYVGDGPRGEPVLFREFHRGPDLPRADPSGRGDDQLTEAVHAAMSTVPDDPDYRSPWHGLAHLDFASYDTTGPGATLEIDLTGKNLARRPHGMGAAEARAAVQQLVYTAQGAVGKRTPVTFTVDRNPTDRLLGVHVAGGVHAGKVLKTLSQVSISTPNEKAEVSGTSLRVTGVANSFEGTVVVYLEKNGRQFVPKPTIAGSYANKLFPWHVRLDLSTVPPGQYVLTARTDDASGKGRFAVDTRTIEVK